MKVLWEAGPSAVQTVQERLAPGRTLAYNTVQTMLNVLHRKGKVRRAPEKVVVPVTDYTVEGNTLKFAVRVKDFSFRDKPAGPAELREALELQGGGDAVWRSLSNSYVDALKKRGEPVPPPPPPTPMKRQR